jgi:uncharacterized damage-inducible protein DinB
MKKLLPLLAILVATPALAQTTASSPSSSMGAARNVWKPAHDYVLKSAQQMPEDKYGFKPTPAVRSFGELLGHVAGSEFMFCAAALGEAPRAENAVEKLKHTKAELIAALQESAAYCERAYTQADAAGAKKIKMFGDDSSVLEVLVLNAAHDYEHYGNIVTYLRINGMVPPSSQPGN